MRKLLTILLFVCNHAFATNWYLSNTGSDANAGNSTVAPWQTIGKLNSMFASMSAGDSVLFKRGDTFYGAIVCAKSSINFRCYGTGAKPIITGFSTISSWTLISGSIYEATVPVTLTALSMVTMNGTPQAIGRYPNAGTANAGYLTYETFSGATSITDNQLTGTPNWTGADVVVRKNDWTIDRRVITSHVGGNITSSTGNYVISDNYNNPGIYSGLANFGYFIQNDIRTLDQLGEWFFNKTTNKISMHFGAEAPPSYNIKVATQSVLLNIGSYNSITVKDIAFEGSIRQGIYFTNSRNITVSDCDFNNIGKTAVQGFQSDNCIVQRCTVTWALNVGIQLYSGNSHSGATIRDCTVKNVGLYAGLASYFDFPDMVGIFAQGLSNIYVGGNRIDSTGRDAIKIGGSNLLVENNWATNADATGQDQGIIYMYQAGTDASPGVSPTNRVIRNNIISHTVGAAGGTSSTSTDVAGIYLDGRTQNVEVYGNFIDSISKNGIHCNNPWNVYVHDNIFFSCGRSLSYMDWGWGSIKNLHMTNNVIWNTTTSQISNYYTNAALNVSGAPTSITVRQTLDTLGYLDSNYYNNTALTAWKVEKYDSVGKGYGLLSYNFANWKTFSGYESHGTALTNVRADSVLRVINPTGADSTITFSGTYKDIKNNKYAGSIKLSPHTGQLLFKTAAAASTPISISFVVTNNSCFGDGTGSIVATATGGTGSKTYLWSDGTTGNTISGKPAGNYSVTATDAAAATATMVGTITQPTPLVASATFGVISAAGDSTNVIVSGSGGTAPYFNTGSFTAAAGANAFTITDAAGCTNTININIPVTPIDRVIITGYKVTFINKPH
jgi:hypothetical protein